MNEPKTKSFRFAAALGFALAVPYWAARAFIRNKIQKRRILRERALEEKIAVAPVRPKFK